MTSAFPSSFSTIKIPGTRSAALDQAQSRLYWLRAFFVLANILILARVIDLAILQGELQTYAGLEKQEITKPSNPVIRRADIVDRNGVLLATTLETASLYADPSMIGSPARVAQDLVRALPDLAYDDVLQKLQRKRRFIWIKRNITPQQQYDVLSLGYPGLNFKNEAHRIYPQERLFSHIVGYTNIDGKGLGGLERHFDNLLHAGGQPLTLTLDVRLQHILSRETRNAIEKFSAKGGAGIIMDVTNGAILAAISLPDFDPHRLGNTGAAARFNRLTLGVYELGSVFKIFSTAALLETQNVRMSKTFDARKPIKHGRFTISDYHAEKRQLTIPEIFMFSSNIGAALMGEMVGTEALKDFYGDLGLLSPASLEIGEIGAPLLPERWRPVNTLTAAYGHGIAVSPLQMITAVASIVNGGTLVQPTLISGISGENTAKSPEKGPKVRVVSPQTAHRMRQLMRLAVTDGTGKKADVPGYRVGGKTGTAEKIGKNGYDRKRLISSFIAVFPMESPRYAVYVMVDEPQGTRESFGYATGGWVAAPAVKRIISTMAPLLGMVPVQAEKEEDIALPLRQYVHVRDRKGNRVASH